MNVGVLRTSSIAHKSMRRGRPQRLEVQKKLLSASRARRHLSFSLTAPFLTFKKQLYCVRVQVVPSHGIRGSSSLGVRSFTSKITNRHHISLRRCLNQLSLYCHFLILRSKRWVVERFLSKKLHIASSLYDIS